MRTTKVVLLGVFALISSLSLAREPMRVTISFDDSSLDHYTIAMPSLEKHGWRGTFNVITAWVDRETKNPSEKLMGKSLNWDQIREMKKRGHEIGTHTVDHVPMGCWFREGRVDEVRRQLVVSRDRIKEETGSAPRYYGAPFGSFAAGNVVRIAAEEGLQTQTDIRMPIGGPAHIGGKYSRDNHPDGADSMRSMVMMYYNDNWKAVDFVFHGLDPAIGLWRPFVDKSHFDRCMDQLKELEKEGKVIVLNCEAFQDYARKAGLMDKWPDSVVKK